MDTIFALSSGPPPAGIAVIRISGPNARQALQRLAGRLPEPRQAQLATFRSSDGEVLDQGLGLWFPGPASATGEDLAELHLHGGRAVVAAVQAALTRLPEFRAADPGEFTRRAFVNGRMDLAEAEGLADLLSAETELQRRAALASAGGALSRLVEGWRQVLLTLSAQLEAILDFSDEEDVPELPVSFSVQLHALQAEIGEALRAPHAEILRDGFRVALAGPPNSGKSSLFNALLGTDAAITAAVAGTTRDVLERPVALAGVPLTFVDMAGLREAAHDMVEAAGIEKAEAELRRADVVLWLGPEGAGPSAAWEIESKADDPARTLKTKPRHRVSARTGEGLAALREDVAATARGSLTGPSLFALNHRQRTLLAEAQNKLTSVKSDEQVDLLIVAEQLRLGRACFDRLTGRAHTEEVLDTLFARFCIGK